MKKKVGLGLVLVFLCTAIFTDVFADSMSFTTIRQGGGTKDWSTTTTSVTMIKKQLTIIGSFPTGRSEPNLQFQRFFLVLDSYDGLDGSNYAAAYVGKSYFEDIFNKGGVTDLYNTKFIDGSAIVTKVDKEKLIITGTFQFSLKSQSPTIGDFNTTVINGKFEASYTSGLTMIAQTSKDPVPARPGDKQKLIKLIVNDDGGAGVPGVVITGVNGITKVKEPIGTTDAKGAFLYYFDIDEKTAGDDYIFRFTAKKDPYKPSDEVTKTVRVSSRYWIYKCGGLDLITFDAGAGQEFKKVNDVSSLLEATSSFTINDFLKLRGKIVVDPTAGQETVKLEGDLLVENFPLPGGTKGDFIMSTGNFTLLPNCDNKLKYLIKQNAKTPIVNGMQLSLDELEFVDLQGVSGLKIKGSLTIEKPQISADLCGKSDNPAKTQISVGLTINPFNDSWVGAWSFSVSNLTTPLLPKICINDISVDYNSVTDVFNIGGKMQINRLIGETTIKGSMSWKASRFDALNAKVDVGFINCMPVPETPLCLKGGELKLSGWADASWKDQSIGIGLFFATSESVILGRFPFLKPLLEKVSIGEIELNGKWQYPLKFSANTIMRLAKTDYISKVKPWQIEMLAGGGELDLTSGLTYNYAGLKAGHFGKDDYFVTADGGTLKMTWSPDLSIEAGIGAKIRIPDIPDDAPESSFRTNLEALKAGGYLPADLGSGRAYISLASSKGFLFETYVDVSSNPKPWINRFGKLYLRMVNSDGTWKFGFGSGNIPMSVARRQANEIQGVGLHNASDDPVICAAPLDTITVTSNIERFNIIIKGQNAAPTAFLIDPSAKRYDNTTTDSTIAFIGNAADKFKLVSVINPAVGKWILGLNNPTVNDSVTIIASTRVRDFSLTANSVARTVTANWDASGYTTADSVRFYLDNDDHGDDGIYVGSAAASAGRFSYTMSDSLPDCEYHLYGRRFAVGIPSVSAYASGIFVNAKGILAAPSNIQAICNQKGETFISWNLGSDPAIYNYAITLKSTFGSDSVIALLSNTEKSTVLQLDTALLKTLRVLSLSFDGISGCPGIPQSIILDIPEQPQAEANQTLPLVIIPNPTSSECRIHYWSQHASSPRVCLTNALGQIVYQSDPWSVREGLNEFRFDSLTLASGSYTVQIIEGYKTVVSILRVVR